ncbi:hypothetical protein R6Q59_028039 [Mikania micrantha]
MDNLSGYVSYKCYIFSIYSLFISFSNCQAYSEKLVDICEQKQAALQSLDLITSKRYMAWQKTHEKIIFNYTKLCFDMWRDRFDKDGLIQYCLICQQVNVILLDEVKARHGSLN